MTAASVINLRSRVWWAGSQIERSLRQIEKQAGREGSEVGRWMQVERWAGRDGSDASREDREREKYS